MIRSLLFSLLLLPSLILNAQEGVDLTLQEVILLAQSESPQVKLAEIRKSNAYWTNQSFLADYKPQIDLGITFPQLNRAVNPITQNNGVDVFIEQSQMRSDMNLSLTQNITATGATVFASTGIQRLDIFETDIINASTSYLSNPISFGFTQPLFAFNNLKWNKRIMPMMYEESKARFSEDLEAVANQAVLQFFDLMVAQLNLEAAYDRKEVADTLFLLGESRYSVGNIAETELLQLQMDVMRADSDIARNKLNQQNSNEALRNFLGIQETTNFNLSLPQDIPEVILDMELALSQSRANRSRIKELQRTLLEAERNVEETKAATSLSGEITGSVGITGFGDNFSDAYSSLLDQERIRLSLNIPIADWGKNKARFEIAKSNYDLTALNTQLETVNFEREVVLAVQSFQLVKDNVEIAKLSYETAQKRYDLTRKRYMIGKIDITDLTLAENEQENQRRNYVQAIREFWQAYYNIRGLTLYDFINQQSLVSEIE